MEQLKTQWKQSFDEAVASIENSLASKPDGCAESSAYTLLANWMINTEHSPYDFMPMGYQDFKSNPYTTDFALSVLHHALVDDGDVAFVSFKIEGEMSRVFMMFVDRHEDSFDAWCRKENSHSIESAINARVFQNKFFEEIKHKYPELSMKREKDLEDGDFTFEAHRDPVRFIKEFEALQVAHKERRLELDQKMKNLQKP